MKLLALTILVASTLTSAARSESAAYHSGYYIPPPPFASGVATVTTVPTILSLDIMSQPRAIAFDPVSIARGHFEAALRHAQNPQAKEVAAKTMELAAKTVGIDVCGGSQPGGGGRGNAAPPTEPE